MIQRVCSTNFHLYSSCSVSLIITNVDSNIHHGLFRSLVSSWLMCTYHTDGQHVITPQHLASACEFWVLGLLDATKQQNMWFQTIMYTSSGSKTQNYTTIDYSSFTWSVDHVVDPAPGLLHTQFPPLFLCHQTSLGQQGSYVLGQNHMP